MHAAAPFGSQMDHNFQDHPDRLDRQMFQEGYIPVDRSLTEVVQILVLPGLEEGRSP